MTTQQFIILINDGHGNWNSDGVGDDTANRFDTIDAARDAVRQLHSLDGFGVTLRIADLKTYSKIEDVEFIGVEQPTVTYLIESYFDRPEVTIRDAETCEVLGRVDYEGQITSSTDSLSVVDLCRAHFIGPVVSVEHDKNVITVVCNVPAAIGINPSDAN